MSIEELETIYHQDQKAISDFKNGLIDEAVLRKIHLENATAVSEHIVQFGFPFKDAFSEIAYKGAFLAIQHSSDIAAMEKVARMILSAHKTQADRQDAAYLIDRAHIFKGLPQIYGTQYKVREGGIIEFLPIEDEEYIDIRRKEMGMETLNEYRKRAESR